MHLWMPFKYKQNITQSKPLNQIIHHYNIELKALLKTSIHRGNKFKLIGTGLTREGYFIDSLVVTKTRTLEALSLANKGT